MSKLQKLEFWLYDSLNKYMWANKSNRANGHTQTKTPSISSSAQLHIHTHTHTHMGESTSVFIRRFVKLKCAYGDLRILTIFRIKRIIFYLFLISFRNLVRSIHPTTCRSMFSEANACTRVAGSDENCCELAGSLLYTSEKSRAVWKKCCVWQRAVRFPSPLTKMFFLKMELEVDSGGGHGRSTVSTLVSKVRWAKGCT